MATDSDLQALLKPYEREIEYCSYCPKLCRFACPVALITCSEVSTPTGKMTILKLARDGAIEFDTEVAELIYQCSGCLASKTYCEHQIEVIGAFEAGRAFAVDKGIAPKRVQEFGERWQKKANPYGDDLAEKIKKLAPNHLAKKNILLFTGCTMPHFFPERIEKLVKILEKLGLDFQIFDGERTCCGYPLYTSGHWKIYEEQKKWLSEKITGYDLILSPCPTCVWFLKEHYQKQGLIEVGEVRHTSEWLASVMSGVELKSKLLKKVAYHDPCHLGRYLGVYDEPRQIIASISEFPAVEFYENKEDGFCCGGGGALSLSHPQIAREIAKKRIEDFKELSADLLATSCPMCERMLERAGKEQNVEVVDLIDLIAQVI